MENKEKFDELSKQLEIAEDEMRENFQKRHDLEYAINRLMPNLGNRYFKFIEVLNGEETYWYVHPTFESGMINCWNAEVILFVKNKEKINIIESNSVEIRPKLYFNKKIKLFKYHSETGTHSSAKDFEEITEEEFNKQKHFLN